jgi:membrane protease YdiL (CAAX protease family)
MPPRPTAAAVELLLAIAIITAGLRIPSIVFALGSAPWLLAAGLIAFRLRGPGWRAAGLARPASIPRTIAIGVLVGLGYQIVGTYLVEPLIARLTSGELPDVSQFRNLVGHEARLAFWLTLSWTLAAVVEELAYRGWIFTRCVEIGGGSRGARAAALLVSSVLFGVVHAYQGLSGMISTGLTGVVFGVAYLASGRNLWTAIIAHGTLDTAGFVMIYAGRYPGL